MKPWIRRLMLILVLALLLSPIAAYLGIMIGNDGIAKRVERELKAYPLPPQTALVESLCAAGKLTGNGNGMQYMGALLITADCSAEEILAHYQAAFAHVEVHRQTTPTIASLHQNNIRFRKPDTADHQRYYAVLCWGSKYDYVGEFVGGMLDWDLRGH